MDHDGGYAFRLLRSGDYAVRFTLPDGRLFTDCLGETDTSSVAVVPGNVGVTATIALGMGDVRSTVHVGGILPGSMGENRHDLNVGGIRPGKIGDTVWHDLDGNGLQDYREPLIPGVPLSLLRVSGDGDLELMEETVSDDYGYYRFRDLRPGAYVVRIGLSEGDVMPYAEFRRAVNERILLPGRREKICGDCQWSSLCRFREET